jgi:hypothetical protein
LGISKAALTSIGADWAELGAFQHLYAPSVCAVAEARSRTRAAGYADHWVAFIHWSKMAGQMSVGCDEAKDTLH